MGDDLREKERINLGGLEGNIYVVLFMDSGVDLKVIFVKVYERFNYVTKKIKFNR